MSKNRTLADFISTSSVSAEEIANGAVTVVKLANTTSSNGTSLIQMSGHSTALNITPAGNVGVGTDDPNTTLEIGGTTNPTIRLEDSAAGSKRLELSIDSSAVGRIKANQSASQLAFETVSTERMRIDSNGNVGIGTSSPSTALEVDGIIASINSGQGTDQLQLQGYGSTGYINMNGSGSLIFRMGSGYSEKMRITGGGNVGIGTTSPSQKLDVNGTIVASTTASQGARIERNGTTGGANFDSVLASGSLHFRTGSTERMRIHSGGQVSIASTEATHGLNVGTSGTDFRGRFQGNNPYRLGLQNGTNNLVWLGSPGSNAFRISNAAGSAVFDIDGSGNVGIGNTAPTHRLSVAAPSAIINLTSTTGTSFNGLECTNGSGSFYFGQDNSAGSFYGVANARVLYSSGTGPIVFFTNGNNERMRIDGSVITTTAAFKPDKYEPVYGPSTITGGFVHGAAVDTWHAITNVNINGYLGNYLAGQRGLIIEIFWTSGATSLGYNHTVRIVIPANSSNTFSGYSSANFSSFQIAGNHYNELPSTAIHHTSLTATHNIRFRLRNTTGVSYDPLRLEINASTSPNSSGAKITIWRA